MSQTSGKDAIAESLETRSSVADTVANQDSANPTQVLTRAVVVEVLYDLAAFKEEDLEEMGELIPDPTLIKTAPRNSIIARPISNGADKQASEAKEKPTEEEKQKAKDNSEAIPEKEKIGEVGVLAYPFFPPHLSMPLKPGEQVWLVSDSPDIPQNVMYWMCRISEPDHVDDVNYTHGDRKLVGSLAPKTAKEKAEAAKKDPPPSSGGPRPAAQEGVSAPPGTAADGAAENEETTFDLDGDGMDDRLFGFPNGTGENDAFTLKDETAYEDLVTVATAYRQFRTQDVPRYTKRPGDLVIQGSNNTLICLGEERGWTLEDDPSSSETSNATENEGIIEEKEGKPFGTIDIVAGRGRYNWRFVGTDVADDPSPPAARTIQNTPAENGRASYVEVNKNPQESDSAENNAFDNPTEGDPDYAGDAARILIAHASDVDNRFTISEPGTTIPTPIGESFGSFDILNKENDNPSFIISKADEIRIVARKFAAGEPVDGAPEINGSIRIIKEGSPSEDLAALMMLPDGTIQISGSKILLGRNPADGGGGGPTTGPGESSSQPYVRYSDLEKLWQDWMDAMQTFRDDVLKHTTPGYGAPSPELNLAVTTLSAAIATLKPQIEDVKSERIFGE